MNKVNFFRFLLFFTIHVVIPLVGAETPKQRDSNQTQDLGFIIDEKMNQENQRLGLIEYLNPTYHGKHFLAAEPSEIELELSRETTHSKMKARADNVCQILGHNNSTDYNILGSKGSTDEYGYNVEKYSDSLAIVVADPATKRLRLDVTHVSEVFQKYFRGTFICTLPGRNYCRNGYYLDDGNYANIRRYFYFTKLICIK